VATGGSDFLQGAAALPP